MLQVAFATWAIGEPHRWWTHWSAIQDTRGIQPQIGEKKHLISIENQLEYGRRVANVRPTKCMRWFKVQAVHFWFFLFHSPDSRTTHALHWNGALSRRFVVSSDMFFCVFHTRLPFIRIMNAMHVRRALRIQSFSNCNGSELVSAFRQTICRVIELMFC